MIRLFLIIILLLGSTSTLWATGISFSLHYQQMNLSEERQRRTRQSSQNIKLPKETTPKYRQVWKPSVHFSALVEHRERNANKATQPFSPAVHQGELQQPSQGNPASSGAPVNQPYRPSLHQEIFQKLDSQGRIPVTNRAAKPHQQPFKPSMHQGVTE